jgi:hypothetical protein
MIRKKCPNAIARAMSDDELKRRGIELRREIPVAQSLLSAIKREQIRRDRQAKKAAKAAEVTG